MRPTSTFPRGLAAIMARYGDPYDYLEDKVAWEARILATATLPVPLPYAYLKGTTVQIIRAHRLVVRDFVEAITECLDLGVPVTRLVYGGCYAWRPKRGAVKLSTHSWGIAIDLDPANNPMGKSWRDDGEMLDPRIIGVFRSRGMTWGNQWTRPDPMHFQCASSY